MALDINTILEDALLALVEQKPLQKITVRDLMERTGISRQGFYNHFLDINALVRQVYEDRVMGEFTGADLPSDYATALTAYYQRMARYHRFMKEAVRQSGQNSLTEFLYQHPYEWDLAYCRRLCAQRGIRIPEDELVFFTKYHSLATVAISIQWVLDDMPFAPEVLAEKVLQMRTSSLNQLLWAEGDAPKT